MKTLTHSPLSWLATAGLVLVSALTVSAAGADTARAEVTYEQPEKFTDVRDGDFESQRGRDHTLDLLRKHIEKRAASTLPAGYTLAVVVSDLDLAGDYEPWRTKFTDVRIVRDIYPPRISLEYTLKDGAGQVVANAKRELTDMAFLQTLAIDRTDTLRFEKALIDTWIRQDIRRALPAS
ncbi:MAG TPA: DUF3016 domain-containing protein [Opitutaceae bacterium]